jgi:hypothetical protein
MTDLSSLDRRPMKLWSWLGAVKDELLKTDPAYIAANLTSEMHDRIIELGPVVARWLLDVAQAAEAIKQKRAS